LNPRPVDRKSNALPVAPLRPWMRLTQLKNNRPTALDKRHHITSFLIGIFIFGSPSFFFLRLLQTRTFGEVSPDFTGRPSLMSSTNSRYFQCRAKTLFHEGVTFVRERLYIITPAILDVTNQQCQNTEGNSQHSEPNHPLT